MTCSERAGCHLAVAPRATWLRSPDAPSYWEAEEALRSAAGLDQVTQHEMGCLVGACCGLVLVCVCVCAVSVCTVRVILCVCVCVHAASQRGGVA